jgi:diguanylate cyclase (GGDEF)-like protein
VKLFQRALRAPFVLLCVLVALCVALPVRALSPDRAISHFGYVWYENQLPQGTVLSITQQANGVIWATTYAGLVRFSGEDFQTLSPREMPALKSSAITSVADDGQGGVWVGSLNGGLYRYRDRTLESVGLLPGIESIIGIVTDVDGALWLTTNIGVVRVINGEAQLMEDPDGFPPRGFYRAIVADPAGGVWIAADGVGVVHWRQGKARLFDEDDGLPSNAVYSLTVDAAGTAWVGTQTGPAYFADGSFHLHPRAASLKGERIYTLYGDRAGAVWFAPLNMGLCRLANNQLACDNALPGLRGETVRSMFEDHEGNLWIGTTSSGLQRLSQTKLVTLVGDSVSNAVRAVHQQPGGPLWIGTDGGGLMTYRGPQLQTMARYNLQLPSQLVRAIQSDAQGQLWVGGTEGVTRFDRDGHARNFGLADGLPGTIVFAFSPARVGGMWVGTLQGAARIEDNKVDVLEGTRGDDIRAVYEDADGRLWLGLRSGIRCFYKGQLDNCSTDGLAGASVFAFYPDANGAMWLGTSVGILRLHNGKVTRYLDNAGFHGDAVFVLLDDDLGNLWFSSNRGIGRLSRADFDALDAGSVQQVAPQWYGTADGMLNSQGNGASQSPGARSEDGQLWFGTAKGVVMVDPRRMQGNSLPPPVAIELLIVDGKEVDPKMAPRLGPGVERLEFHFAAMSYVAPSAVRYRYRLEGFDREWRDAGNARRAYYTNLPPGDYSFRVMASNNDGVWNEQGDKLDFKLLPHWHQTWWVRSLAVLALLALAITLMRLRLLAAERREQQLTIEVARRTEALREANERLERIASQDALTGIANRREFNQRLLMAWQQQAEHDKALAVLLIDVDEFKAYNDAHGHLAGDNALSQVASIISTRVGNGKHMAARYGGEEFAALLPDFDRDGAFALAKELVTAIHDAAMPHRASPISPVITISVGVACVYPAQAESPEALLHAADRALYAAKHAGRNRAVAAASSASAGNEDGGIVRES